MVQKKEVYRHAVSALYMSAEAVAPVIISTSSPVMTACRVRLKRIWYLLIISPAFFDAFCDVHVSIKDRLGRELCDSVLTSIALRRADCSQA